MVRNILNILALSLLFIACSGDKKKDHNTLLKDVGVITFDVNYPSPPDDPFIKSTLPDSIIYFFKNDWVRTEVNLAKGNIQLNYIANSTNKSLEESMKVYFTKSKYPYTSSDVKEYLAKYPKYQIQKTGNKKRIADYICDESEVILDTDTFYIYHTNELQAQNPNWFTPFPQVDGVILEYQMIQYNFLMQVTARKIEMIQEDSLSFDFGDEFNLIDKAELDRNHSTFEQFGS